MLVNKPSLDNQRCLFIVGFTYATSTFFYWTFLSYLISDFNLFLIMTAALGMAVAKSGMQLPTSDKSVLVTGEGLALSESIENHLALTLFGVCQSFVLG